MERRISKRFESSVIYEGTKTVLPVLVPSGRFESSVIYEGTKTLNTKICER